MGGQKSPKFEKKKSKNQGKKVADKYKICLDSMVVKYFDCLMVGHGTWFAPLQRSVP